MPDIGEMMVFGEGFTLESAYESDWFDVRSSDVQDEFVNFDSVEWEGVIRDGTNITIQTKTKNVLSDPPGESDWSSPERNKSFKFNSPEPATHFKYKVNLSTHDLLRTPVFNKFKINYSITDQPVSSADGSITPTSVAMGADSTFVYTLSYVFNTSADSLKRNIKELSISVPGFPTFNHVVRSDTGDTLRANGDLTVRSTIDTLFVTFADSITGDTSDGADTLYVSFNTKLLRSSHTFEAFLFNSDMNDKAGGIKVWKSEMGKNTVMVSTLLKSVLTNVKAIPKVFTPNKNNGNYFTVIEFRLAKVKTNVMVKIYSTAGNLVATINNEVLDPMDYSVVRSAANIGVAKELPGYWDGKDEDGDLVPPGIYIYQVIAETDEGDVVEGGTVVVAY